MGTNIGGVSIETSRVRVQFALTYILHLSQLPCVSKTGFQLGNGCLQMRSNC